jgi:hypothetical protein
LRTTPLRRGVQPRTVARNEGGGGAHLPVPFGLSSPPTAAAAGAARCTPFATTTTRLGMRCRLAASSAPSSASWSRSCSNPGPSSPVLVEGQRLKNPAQLTITIWLGMPLAHPPSR